MICSIATSQSKRLEGTVVERVLRYLCVKTHCVGTEQFKLSVKSHYCVLHILLLVY